MATLLKSLKHMQRKHTALLAKLEKTALALARRKRKLGALETGIAVLERRIAEPRTRRSATGEVGEGVRPALLIFNPTSGRDAGNNAERLSQTVRSLRAHGIEAAIGLKTSGKAARTLARGAVRDGVPLVIVAAGDGTIGEVASQLVGTETVLGIVPIGTMNNIARSLGVPLTIEDACALIGMGTTRHLDVGKVRTNGGASDEYFLECAGVGLSAIAAMAGQAAEKRRWRVLPRALKRLFEAKPGTMRIELDGTVIDAATRIVTVSNSPLMGNNMLAAPEAKMDDGFLDVRIYDGMGDAELVRHFLTATSHEVDGLKSYRVRHLRITTEAPVLSNTGAHVAPERNVIEIDVVPGALSMIVGNGIGLTMPVESAPEAPTYAPAPPESNGSPEDDAVQSAPVKA